MSTPRRRAGYNLRLPPLSSLGIWNIAFPDWRLDDSSPVGVRRAAVRKVNAALAGVQDIDASPAEFAALRRVIEGEGA